MDPTKSDGYAFEGDHFLGLGRRTELDAGTVLLRYDEQGTAKKKMPTVRVLIVEWDGSLQPAVDRYGILEVTTWDWVAELKDRVAALVDVPTGPNQRVLSCQLTVFHSEPTDEVRAAFDGMIVGSWTGWDTAASGLINAIRDRMNPDWQGHR